MSTTLAAPTDQSTAELSAPPAPADRSRLPQARFAFLDALRGLAALAVACHHIDRFGPLCDAVWRIEPDFISEIVENCRVGVRVFFVLSGFVIAYSVRKAWITPGYFGNFALRRSIRLEPPYWVTIGFVLALNYLAGWLALDPPGDDPSGLQILAHLVYVQEIVGFDHISVGIWTLCIELQFYLLFVLLLGIAQRRSPESVAGSRWLPKPIAMLFLPFALWSQLSGKRLSQQTALALTFVPLALWSLFGASLADEALNSAWLTRYFWAFFLGALVCWTLDGQTSRGLLWGYVAAMAVRLGFHFTIDAAVGLVTGLAIYTAGRRGQLGHWLNWRWLQYLGRVSYSFYLIHYPVNHVIAHLGHWLTGDSSAFAVMWMFISLAVSIAAAQLLYFYVEAPSIRLSRSFRREDKERVRSETRYPETAPATFPVDPPGDLTTPGFA